MSHEERNTVAALIAGLLVNAYVIWKLRTMAADGLLSGPAAIETWARAMLWVIPVGIALVIAMTILVSIGHAIVTGEPKPSFIVDERDKAIQVFGMRVTMVIVGAGFIGMVVALALGVGTLSALIGLWFAMAAGDIFGNLGRIYRYRRG